MSIFFFFHSFCTTNASPVGRTAITSQPLVPPIATDDEMKWNTPSSLELKHTPATPIPYFIFFEQLSRTPELKSFQGNEFLSLFRIKVTYMVGGSEGGGGGEVGMERKVFHNTLYVRILSCLQCLPLSKRKLFGNFWTTIIKKAEVPFVVEVGR